MSDVLAGSEWPSLVYEAAKLSFAKLFLLLSDRLVSESSRDADLCLVACGALQSTRGDALGMSRVHPVGRLDAQGLFAKPRGPILRMRCPIEIGSSSVEAWLADILCWPAPTCC